MCDQPLTVTLDVANDVVVFASGTETVTVSYKADAAAFGGALAALSERVAGRCSCPEPDDLAWITASCASSQSFAIRGQR